jgi:hypothetical protein
MSVDPIPFEEIFTQAGTGRQSDGFDFLSCFSPCLNRTSFCSWEVDETALRNNLICN